MAALEAAQAELDEEPRGCFWDPQTGFHYQMTEPIDADDAPDAG